MPEPSNYERAISCIPMECDQALISQMFALLAIADELRALNTNLERGKTYRDKPAGEIADALVDALTKVWDNDA